MVGANKCPKKAPTENMGSDIYDKLDGANTFLTFTQAERAQPVNCLSVHSAPVKTLSRTQV